MDIPPGGRLTAVGGQRIIAIKRMQVERSAGIILFRNTPHGRRYLVIRSSRSASLVTKRKKVVEFWDLPKGVLESGERGIDAALREAKEEVGIVSDRMDLVEGFKKTVRYFTRRGGKTRLKFAAFFLARVKTARVRLSWEHDRFEWLAYRNAHVRLSLPQMKDALEAAERTLR